MCTESKKMTFLNINNAKKTIWKEILKAIWEEILFETRHPSWILIIIAISYAFLLLIVFVK